MSRLDLVHREPDIVGESPLWCSRRGALLWIDIRGCAVRVLRDRQVASFPVPSRPGFIVASADGRFVVGLQEGLHFWSPEDDELLPIPDAGCDGDDHRFNDGRCDTVGRLWTGTMDAARRGPSGSLYRFSLREGFIGIRHRLMVPNSLAFFDENGRLLFSDSTTGVVEAYAFDLEAGVVSSPTVFMEHGIAPGEPDGVAVDADGCLWMARFGGGCVIRISPNGKVIGRIDLPTANITSCAFGDRDLGTLFITSATALLTAAELRDQPEAGALFAIRPGVHGMPQPCMAV